jgi:hypothetical protein
MALWGTASWGEGATAKVLSRNTPGVSEGPYNGVQGGEKEGHCRFRQDFAFYAE